MSVEGVGRGESPFQQLSVCVQLPASEETFVQISPGSPFPALASQEELAVSRGPHWPQPDFPGQTREERCPGLSCSLQPVSLRPPAPPPPRSHHPCPPGLCSGGRKPHRAALLGAGGGRTLTDLPQSSGSAPGEQEHGFLLVSPSSPPHQGCQKSHPASDSGAHAP